MNTLRSRVIANTDWLANCHRMYREDNCDIGRHARALRESAHLTLRKLARCMGVSAPFLSDLELGRRVWSASHCDKWETAMKSVGAWKEGK